MAMVTATAIPTTTRAAIQLGAGGQPGRPRAPYLTSQTYDAPDGYRYPLYYNPATASYIYYPVAR